MAVDEKFVDRIRQILVAKKYNPIEKRMFGGIAFMINGNMCVGIMNDGKFMARVGKEQNTMALKKPFCEQMNFKRPMVGYVVVEPVGVKKDSELIKWIDMCLEFNKTLPKK